jgi:hypothetical protein
VDQVKIRDGFVSNSSSSSFVVCFPKKPESVEEVQKLVFGDKKIFGNPYPGRDEEGGWPTSQVAETIWNDLKDQEPMTPEQMSEEMGDYMFGEFVVAYTRNNPHPESPDWPDGMWDDKTPKKTKDKMRAEYDAAYAEYDKKRTAWAAAVTEAFQKQHPGVYFKFHYSDNDGSYFSALEHGHLFDRLPHCQISHH